MIKNIISEKKYDLLVFGVGEMERKEDQNKKMKAYFNIISKFQKNMKYSIVTKEKDHIIKARDKSSFEKYSYVKGMKFNRNLN